MYVQALRDFGYDEEKVGHVRRGQVFELGGYANDDSILLYRYALRLDPQPKSETALQKMNLPTCGTCGRIFMEEHLRDACGRAHEMTSVERETKKRQKAHKRYEESVQEEQAALEPPVQVLEE